MTPHPLRVSRVLSPDEQMELRRRSVLELGKLDPQAGDRQSIAPVLLALGDDAWTWLARCAERLNSELLACEEELLSRPQLLRRLALPRRFRSLLSHPRAEVLSQHVRVTRFDFHPTADGWRVSEANSDVPGGYLEAAGLPTLLPATSGTPAPDPGDRLAQAFARRLQPDSLVAFVHATAFSDDRQVMMFLARRFQRLGLRTTLLAPHQLAIRGGSLHSQCDWSREPVAGVVRFFPCEWLANYPRSQEIAQFFSPAPAVLCNPGQAIASQSKCWMQLLDELATPVPAWRALAPEVRRPRRALRRDPQWVLKPALGRVGEDVLVSGVTPTKVTRRIRRAAAWRPDQWIAQRRFHSLPIDSPFGPLHACIGVFVIDRETAGMYARVAPSPIINAESQDAAIVIEPSVLVHSHTRASAGVPA